MFYNRTKGFNIFGLLNLEVYQEADWVDENGITSIYANISSKVGSTRGGFRPERDFV